MCEEINGKKNIALLAHAIDKIEFSNGIKNDIDEYTTI